MNDSEPVRLGFVGAGGICEQRHLPGLAKIPGIQLVAVCNRSAESSQRAQTKWGFARAEADWRRVVEAADIDAVFVGTWPYLHREISVAALAAGKHVFCQARLCMDWRETLAMVAAADAQPRLVNMVCPSPHRVRWERTVKQLLASGTIGCLRSVVVLSTNGANRDPNVVTWRERIELSGINVLQVGIFAETLNAWCSDYERLSATTAIPLPVKRDGGRDIAIQIPQMVSVVGRLTGNVLCTEHHSGLAAGPARSEILLLGSAAACKVDLQANRVVLHPDGSETSSGQLLDDAGDDWQVEREFIDAVRSARRGEPWEVRPDFREAARYMRKMQALHDSARDGRVVTLADL